MQRGGWQCFWRRWEKMGSGFDTFWGSATLTAVGQQFGRDVATVSITVRRLQERAKHSEALQDCLASLGIEDL
jgi:hypothetical protein